MADPFSVVAGTAGLADVCVRLTHFLKRARDGSREVDRELKELFEEIGLLQSELESLELINNSVKDSYVNEAETRLDSQYRRVLETHWRATQNTLASCQSTAEQIEALLQDVAETGSGKHLKLDQIVKWVETKSGKSLRVDQLLRWMKQQSKGDALRALREKLKAHQIALQVSLSAVNLIYTRTSEQTSHESFSDLSKSILNLGVDLELKICSLEKAVKFSSDKTLEPAIESAQNIVPLSYLNQHFFTPQTVSSIFTGREGELAALQEHLSSTFVSSGPQKRFVIYGLAGAGKTQFCCKFASDNKQRFWGVFWINASSKEHAEQSFSTISTLGKVTPNQAAVKSWLSSLGPDKPWLLIIDNADEKDFPVEECFPDSNAGTILMTTRNPMLKTRGTVGPRYFEFQGLEEKKSVELLLNAANESLPWVPSSMNLARTIAKTLGYLPLALIHAGKTILARLCTLENYLDFFEKSWARIRQEKESDLAPLTSGKHATIYSSYELIHTSISSKKTQVSEDALDLLRIFPFLDRQHIKLDIFLRAALNPGTETLDDLRKDKERKAYSKLRPKLTLAQTLRHVVVRVVSLLYQLGHRPILPRFLSHAGAFDETRLREAVEELVEMSLISSTSNQEDTYSMHAVVHLWARQRPEMTLIEKAIWCQMTATILSRAILLPPLGDTEENEIFRRDILPHVSHVQKVEQAILGSFAKNRESRRKILPILQPPITSDRLIQMVKFSTVYAQGHQLDEAERLQTFVANFAIQKLGMENLKTIGIIRLLAWTYWQLARVDEAVDLQKKALDACIKVLGRDNPETLQIMDSYGSSLWLQGRIPEARKVHTAAVEGLKKTLGPDHIETLKAMGGLGRAVGKDFEFHEAINIQTTAFTKLKAQLGPSHTATLEAMDNLAMAYFDRAAYRQGQPGHLNRALELEQEVFATRKEKLGREHYHTLWSGLNLARIRAIRGEIDEALSIFLPGHAIVRRDLGEDHFIYLFGELHHGRILMCAKRYEDAERILFSVVESHREKRHQHPDRLLAMFSLIKCWNVLGKQEQAVKLLEELMDGTKALFGPDHAAVEYLVNGEALSKEASDMLDIENN